MKKTLYCIIEVLMVFNDTSSYTLRSRDRLLSLSTPRVMGILNVTDDSFYSGSRVSGNDEILSRAHSMLDHGAEILDIGAMSSRPGAINIPLEEEIARLTEAIRLIKTEFPDVWVSADASRIKVVNVAIEAGADIVNDITGGVNNPEVYSLCAMHKVPYICMHMRGTPADMQSQTEYNDVVVDIIDFFAERVQLMESLGLYDYILDPGFGFAKTLDQNYTLLKNLSSLHLLQSPILAGISRKSMIYKHLNISADEALNGTTALHMSCLERGAAILRVHDVKEAVETRNLFVKLKNS